MGTDTLNTSTNVRALDFADPEKVIRQLKKIEEEQGKFLNMSILDMNDDEIGEQIKSKPILAELQNDKEYCKS